MSDTAQLEVSDRASPRITIRVESIPWEPIIYGLLIIVAASMRLWDLWAPARTTTTRAFTPTIAGSFFRGTASSTIPYCTARFCFTLLLGGCSFSATTWWPPACSRPYLARLWW